MPEIFKASKELYKYYLHRSFHIMTVHADGEFGPWDSLIESLLEVLLVNLDAENEHVPDTEKQIRLVKKGCRVTRQGLPFRRIPKLLTTHIFINTVKVIKFFPMKREISDSISPKTIVPGETFDFKKNLRIQI